MLTLPTKMLDQIESKGSEALYESLFTHMLDGLAYCRMITDEYGQVVDFVYMQVNKNFEKLTGMHDVVGKRVTDLIPGIRASNPEMFDAYARVSFTGEPEQIEIYVAALSRWFLISVYSPSKGYFVAVFQNITAQKQITRDLENAKIAARNVFEDLKAEKEMLAHAKAKDDALLQSLGEGVLAVDQEGKVIIVNKVAERLLGFTSQEIMGESFVEVIMLEDAEGNRLLGLEQPISIALSLSVAAVATVTSSYFVRKDGTKFPAAITATPVLLDAKPAGAIVVFRDITKEKEIEKLRTDFLTLASHQLRTPLSGTKWLIETIQRRIIGELNAKQKEYLDNLFLINERMIQLVSEMLNVLTLEGGAVPIKKEEIQVLKLYAELFLMMEPASRSKKVTLRNALNNDKIFVQSDFQILRSILENFVSNALNYSQSGKEVVFDAHEDLAEVIFSVQDNGIGIPKEEQKRIFERFYRASNAKGVKPDGTGLGLYTAFQLAQKIGGKISFDSSEGKGTTFYLRIPKASSINKLL